MADTYFIDSSGAVVPVSADQVAGAAQLGWVPASPKQIAEAQLLEKHGTPIEATKAFGEHAASALTLGLSDVVERKLGVDPEAMRAREEANPIASALGTVAGVGAGVLIPGTGPALVAKAGKAGAEVARGVLPVAEGVAGKIAAKAAAAGAGSAIEGAAYGLGQVVHEAALGDPNLTAQSALATVGLSAALGGALGGAGGLLGHALGEGAKALPDWLASFEGERNLKAAGGIQKEISRLVDQKGRPNLRAIGREGGELGLVGPLSTPESTAEKAHELLTSTGEQMGSLLERADTKLGEAQTNGFKLIKQARRQILAPLERNPLQQDAAGRLSTALDGYAERFAATDGRVTLQGLQQMRREVSDALYGLRGNRDPFADSYRTGLHELRGLISDEINRGVERAGIPASEWKALNRKYEVGSVFQDLAERGMNRAHGNNLVSPTELLSAVGGGATLGAVGGAASGVGAAFLRRHASGILGAAARALREAIDTGAVEGVVSKTADAIAAERGAGLDIIGADVAAEARKLASLEGPHPFSKQAIAAEAKAQETAGRVEAEKLRRVEAGRSPGTGGSLSVAEARAQAEALRTAEAMGAASGAVPGARPMVGESDRMAMALGLREPVIASAPEKIAALALLEQINQTATKKVENGIGILVRGSPKAANVGRGEVAAGIARAFGDTHEDAKAAFTKRTEQIRALSQDPGTLQEKLASQTDDWHEHAPNTAQALQIATARAVAFLSSKLPQTGQAGPLSPKPTPSRAEISKFTRYYEAVQNPFSLLKQAAAGTLTPEAVEAVRTVYPELFDRMRAAAVEKLAEHPKGVPYKSKLMLSMLMGQDMDGTTMPAALLRNRMILARPIAPPPRPAPSRADKLTLASRFQTPGQASAARGGMH